MKRHKNSLNRLESKVIMIKNDAVLPAEIFGMNARKYFGIDSKKYFETKSLKSA